MRKSDVIVIGSGLAGLIAAVAAAEQGKNVTVLTKGVGTLIFGNGVIDVLGYLEGQPVTDCRRTLPRLPAHHPYSVIGMDKVQEALTFFKNICAQEDYSFDGDLERNIWLPTSAGTIKPSCLVPKSMNPVGLSEAAKITVISFVGLKDFYPQLIIKGLSSISGYSKQYNTVTVNPGFTGKRDVTALDVARWLDTKEGQDSFVCQLKETITPGAYALIPPVLGTEPSYVIWRSLEERLQCRITELIAPPPAVTGSRLRTLLLRVLKKQGVNIVEQGHVQRGECRDNRCMTVTTRHLEQERGFQAEAVILATGSFLGGGLAADPTQVYETVFGLPVTFSDEKQPNTETKLFGPAPQPFARYGVRVNQEMCPVNASGNVLLENVHAAGNILGGYDYCLEKSGNGVAVTSGYHAAMTAVRRMRI